MNFDRRKVLQVYFLCRSLICLFISSYFTLAKSFCVSALLSGECTFNEKEFESGDIERCAVKQSETVVAVLKGVYMLVSNILLLNLLIALFRYEHAFNVFKISFGSFVMITQLYLTLPNLFSIILIKIYIFDGTIWSWLKTDVVKLMHKNINTGATVLLRRHLSKHYLSHYAPITLDEWHASYYLHVLRWAVKSGGKANIQNENIFSGTRSSNIRTRLDDKSVHKTT